MPAGWLLYPTPAQNHPRKLCLRGARCGGGHSGMSLLVHSLPCHSRVGGNRVYKIRIADCVIIKTQHGIIPPIK